MLLIVPLLRLLVEYSYILKRAELEEKTKEVFGQAIDIIINKLGLANIALSIFSERNIAYVTDKPSLMALGIVGNGEYLWKINITNCSQLHPNEMAWIIVHETLHYILQHVKMGPLFRNHYCANISMDIIVNDLMKEVFLEAVDESFFKVFKYKYYSGPNTLGLLSCDMGLEDIYRKVMLMPHPPDELEHQLDNHECHNSDSPHLDSAGEDLGRMFTNDNGDDADDRGSKSSTPPLTQEDVKRKPAGYGTDRGDGQLVGLARAVFNFGKVFVKLTGKKLLRGSDDDLESTWLKRPRAMISLDPNKGMLPGIKMEPSKKNVIDVFIDVSGSVTPEQCNFFANFVNFIPRKKYVVRFHSFNTEVHSDIEVDSQGKIVNIKCGGGTNFDAVARFVLTETPTPDNIIIVTDGEDKIDNSLVKNINQWTWIVDSHYKLDEVIKDAQLFGKIFTLKEITKELSR